MSSDDPPRIYVASLADYNAGRLHGVWIDATDDIGDIWAQVHKMLEKSAEPGAEEFAIHDHDGFWPAQIGEYEPLDTVHQIAVGIQQHGRAFAHWIAIAEPEDRLDENLFEERFRGHWPSMREYAGEVLDEIFDAYEEGIPEGLRPYVRVDVDLFAEDLMAITSMSRDDSGVYVFDTE